MTSQNDFTDHRLTLHHLIEGLNAGYYYYYYRGVVNDIVTMVYCHFYSVGFYTAQTILSSNGSFGVFCCGRNSHIGDEEPRCDVIIAITACELVSLVCEYFLVYIFILCWRLSSGELNKF